MIFRLSFLVFRASLCCAVATALTACGGGGEDAPHVAIEPDQAQQLAPGAQSPAEMNTKNIIRGGNAMN